MGIKEMINNKLKSLYIGKCKIISYGDIEEDGLILGQGEQVLYKDVPCRISFNSGNQPIQNLETGVVAILFLSKEFKIPINSKIIINQNENEYIFKNSGLPRIYEYHQELMLRSDIYA